jgi:hypothetical protein
MMPRKLPARDPISAYAREIKAARSIGENAQCVCGEARPEALIANSRPIICAACKRRIQGRTTMDKHHFAGRANGPDTVLIPVNDHRAELNPAQYDWPKETRENPEGSPLRSAAAHVRGFVDTVMYLIERGLLWIANMLEKLDECLTEKMGPKWWLTFDLQAFLPKR